MHALASLPSMSGLSLQARELREGYRRKRFTPVQVIDEVLRRITARGEDHVWTARASHTDLRERACWLAAHADRIDDYPLFGLPFSVKDNLDVAGMPTTCGCAAFDRQPSESATTVARALAAGAILIGKNTLDQFATGLNGTRTMGGHCHNVFDPRYIPGGSSSGSGVAVAARLVTFALGSDTGGSGRIPAAMNNVVGLRPTIGLASVNGLVHNNRFLDVVPVFAQTVEDAFTVMDVIRGHDDADPYSRPDADALPRSIAVPEGFRFGVPAAPGLAVLDAHSQAGFGRAVQALRSLGGEPVEVDFQLFTQAGRMVFESALVAERAASYGRVLDGGEAAVFPAVASILQQARRHTGTEAFEAIYRMQALRHRARRLFETRALHCLLTPTLPRPYTCEEVEADPIARNAEIGHYTYGVAVLDLCALALPAAIRPDGLPFGISLVAPAGRDGALRTLGERFERHVRLAPGIAALPTASFS